MSEQVTAHILKFFHANSLSIRSYHIARGGVQQAEGRELDVLLRWYYNGWKPEDKLAIARQCSDGMNTIASEITAIAKKAESDDERTLDYLDQARKRFMELKDLEHLLGVLNG